MPYIKDKDKMPVEISPPLSPGELNYALAKVVDRYFYHYNKSYKTLNDVVGVLDNLKFEIQRRFLAPYEDQKRFDNGEVFKELLK